MGRRVDFKGNEYATSLKDLKKGDRVYVSFYSSKYIQTTVTRVRTVECATIVTVMRKEGMYANRFAGYHTGNIALSCNDGMLVLNEYSGEWLANAMKKAEGRSIVCATRAEALTALVKLKDWLNMPEDEYGGDRDVD